MSNSSADKKSTLWRPGITNYFAFMSVTLLCLLFPTISLFFFYQISTFRDSQLDRTILLMQDNLKHYGIATARSLTSSAEEAIAGYDYTFLNELLKAEVANNPELVYGMVVNDSGRIIAHNQITNIGTAIDEGLSWEAHELMTNDFQVGAPKLLVKEKESFKTIKGSFEVDGQKISVMEVLMPVRSGKKIIGIFRGGFSMKDLENEITKTQLEWNKKMIQFRKLFFVIGGVFFLVGLGVTFFFSHFFIKSTRELSSGAYKVSEGDLGYKISSKKMFCREFVSFADVFNEMTTRLRASLKELDHYSRSLEHLVDIRTRALKEAQDELLHQAHEAGMAEMAVGVLHNIGNAITPAKVDAALLLRRFRDSAISANLPEVLQQIQVAFDDPQKLDSEERERLKAIIALLPEGIKEDYDYATMELKKICAKHDHIESIISLQMRYAHLIGEREKIDLNLIIEDALTMLADSLSRRNVEVEINFSDNIPMVQIEKAKMIQIVINLLKNGYEAMDNPDLADRRLIVSTSYEAGPPPNVVLKVRDTGVGFDPAKKEKLFKFGYTTKSTGSGFGLHSCANFLIAHKGSLAADSEGKGLGAEFTVKLPAFIEESKSVV